MTTEECTTEQRNPPTAFTDNIGKRKANLRPWQPGQSGNPKGRKKLDHDAVQYCRDASQPVLKRLKNIALHSPSEKNAIAAGNSILDRAWGRPKQQLSIENPANAPDLLQYADPDTLRMIADIRARLMANRDQALAEGVVDGEFTALPDSVDCQDVKE